MINFSLIILLLVDGIHTMENAMQAVPGQFNYMVSIWRITPRTDGFRCSGTIISRNHILTAGHCVHNVETSQISITAGSVDPNDRNEQKLIITNINIHPRFHSAINPAKPDTLYWLNDIAVLNIKHELMWSLSVAPVELDWRATYWTTCEECYIAGWNPVFINTSIPLYLQWTPAIVLSHEAAVEMKFFLSPNELPVILMNDNAAVTATDTGAPLICGKTQVGIVIADRNAPSILATWLTIAPYNDFIDSILHDGRTKIRTFETRNIVSIWHQGEHLCGGIIVDDYHIVTAAHCVYNVQRIDLRVISGRTQIVAADTTLEWLLVERKEIHPSYEVISNNYLGNECIQNNIAVLKVTGKLPWIASMKLEDLPEPTSILVDQGQVFRWFRASSCNEPVLELMKTPAAIFTELQCLGFGVHLHENQFCAKSQNTLPVATQEDIGNPIVYMDKIIGMVVSVGSTFKNTPTPTIFLQIYSYREFINDAIQRSADGTRSLKNGHVDTTHHQFVVSIWQHTLTTHQYRCTGIMISKTHVLTAGRCVRDVENYDIFIFTGRIIPQNMDSVLFVENIYIHPDFQSVCNLAKPNTAFWMNDIAILSLGCQPARDLGLGLGQLDRSSQYQRMCGYCVIAGWNHITTNTTTLVTLNWASAMIIRNEESDQSDSFLLENEIYAFLTHSQALVDDTDSGGPLICKQKIVGIIIGERDRTHSVATVLTIAPYLEFIDYILNGGKIDVHRRELQSIVSIWNSHDSLCSGFIVHDYHIVTAAHCIYNVAKDHLRVSVGQISDAINGLSVERIYIHPRHLLRLDENFAIQNIENDIAVLKLTSALPWNPRIDLVKLPDVSEISGKKSIQVLRWPHTTSGDTDLRTLMKSSAIILLNQLCEYPGFHLADEEFCIANEMKFPIATEKDIGNPIFYENNIIAMVVDVRPNFMSDYAPAVCLRIFTYREFINNAINTP